MWLQRVRLLVAVFCVGGEGRIRQLFGNVATLSCGVTESQMTYWGCRKILNWITRDRRIYYDLRKNVEFYRNNGNRTSVSVGIFKLCVSGGFTCMRLVWLWTMQRPKTLRIQSRFSIYKYGSESELPNFLPHEFINDPANHSWVWFQADFARFSKIKKLWIWKHSLTIEKENLIFVRRNLVFTSGNTFLFTYTFVEFDEGRWNARLVVKPVGKSSFVGFCRCRLPLHQVMARST